MAECKEFADYLVTECGIKISDFTLARLMGIVVSKSLPSKYTLDSLSEYCGYTDWQSFVAKSQHETDESKNRILNPAPGLFQGVSNNELMLLQSCIENKAYVPVIEYLYKMAPAIIDDFETRSDYKIVRLLARAISRSEDARNALIPAIARETYMRNLYFNNMVDMEGIVVYYGDMVEKYYLKNIRPTSDSFMENDIWAWCMIMYKHLYAQNLKDFLKTGYMLFKRYNADEITNESIPNYYPVARFHACQIMYKFFSSPCTPNSWYEKKLQFILKEVDSIPEARQVIFIPQIAEALYVSGQNELIFAFSPYFDKFIQNYFANGTFSFESDNLYKLMFYLHLALDKSGTFEKNCIQNKNFIGKEIDCPIVPDDFYLADYMSLVVHSMYVYKTEASRDFLEQARKIAVRLKNKHFEKIAQRFIARSGE
ncbi:MAG: hypothetical protein RB294_07210 [Bacteroidales bacterium]|nr:hypothetical protein [Bacteroidales bacterium]